MLDLRSGRILRLATQATHIATKQLSNDASKPRAKTSKQNKLLPKIDGHKYSVKKSPFASAPTELTLRRRQHEHTARSPPSQSSSRCQNSDAEWGSQTLRQACYRENPESAMCVQNLNDSRGLAIRITYRISLRSSSLWEPRHPPLKVVLDFSYFEGPNTRFRQALFYFRSFCHDWYVLSKTGKLIPELKKKNTQKETALNQTDARGVHRYRLIYRANSSQSKRSWIGVVMILPQVHLRKPCYDFTFL